MLLILVRIILEMLFGMLMGKLEQIYLVNKCLENEKIKFGYWHWSLLIKI